jgi:hypothetical protein
VTRGELGDPAARGAIATDLGIPRERVAIAASRASLLLALFYVLADLGDEALDATDDPVTREAAVISGLSLEALDALDAESLFESVGERTRAVVIGEATSEIVTLLAELEVPILCGALAPDARGLFEGADAPLLVWMGTVDHDAWLAVLGPEDRAAPLLTRLEQFAHVFFAPR